MQQLNIVLLQVTNLKSVARLIILVILVLKSESVIFFTQEIHEESMLSFGEKKCHA